VHEDDDAAAALALRERDLLTAHVDLLFAHPLVPSPQAAVRFSRNRP
jgi:hypothetical protein